MTPLVRNRFVEEEMPIEDETTDQQRNRPKSPFSGGKVVYDDAAVQVRTGVSYANSAYKDGIAIMVKCGQDPHVVQFINREVLDAQGKPKSLPMRTTGGQYQTTTDPQNPVWNTDSAAKPDPYYEAAGASDKQTGSLTTFDQPTLEAPAGPLHLAPGESSQANFQSYAICNGQVTRQINWTRSVTQGGTPSYNVNVSKVSALPTWATNLMQQQGFHNVP